VGADIFTGFPLWLLEATFHVPGISPSHKYCRPHQMRAFDNEEVMHVDDSNDPVRDLSLSICSSPI
jgi:hypothetical protein